MPNWPYMDLGASTQRVRKLPVLVRKHAETMPALLSSALIQVSSGLKAPAQQELEHCKKKEADSHNDLMQHGFEEAHPTCMQPRTLSPTDTRPRTPIPSHAIYYTKVPALFHKLRLHCKRKFAKRPPYTPALLHKLRLRCDHKHRHGGPELGHQCRGAPTRCDTQDGLSLGVHGRLLAAKNEQ